VNTLVPKDRVIDTIQLVPLDDHRDVVPGALTPAGVREAIRASSYRRRLFIALVALPMFFVGGYLALIASPRYVSEAAFIVRSASYQGPSMVQQASASLASSHAPSDLPDAVRSYILSRDMVDELARKDNLHDIMSRPEGDFVARFPNFYTRDNQERLYRHYLKMVDATLDKQTGINTIEVVTFNPSDSKTLANAILLHSEELINRLNSRMIADAEAYAQTVLDRAKQHVLDVERDFTKFRIAVGSVDPTREASSALDQIGQMSTELAGMRAALQEQMSLSPSSPAIPGLKERIRTFQDQIEVQKAKIVGSDVSLAAKLSEFERLSLERQLASREMDSAVAGLTAARQDAQRQHLYLQRITEPNHADEAKYPRRVLWILFSFALCLSLYFVANAILKGVMEHRA
jgi:capsular polysaccharide transport system permease protein